MKKRLLAVLLTAAMVLGMTACGSKSNSGSSDKKEEAQSTDDIKECTIKFQYWADNTDYSSLMQDIIKKFNEENKYGITVEGSSLGWWRIFQHTVQRSYGWWSTGCSNL